jgi:hypothetical protein
MFILQIVTSLPFGVSGWLPVPAIFYYWMFQEQRP